MSRYTRAQWGARYRAGFGDRSQNYPLNEVWGHHSVTAQLGPNATFAQECAQMRVLENIGQQRFKGGISYSFAFFPSGRAYHGLGASRIGAHTGGRNSISISFVFVGNYENTVPTAAALGAAAQCLKDLRAQGIIRQPRMNGGHRDAPGQPATACPGRHLHSRISVINSQAAGRVTQAPARPAPAPTTSSSSSNSNRHRSEQFTNWPQRALQVRDFPVGTYWLRLGDSGRVIPNEYRHALVLALHGAGYEYKEQSVQGAWRQIRDWLRGQHGYNTPTDRRSVARDFQRYLQRQGLYRGAIDGVLGPQSIWAITTWLNRIRSAYNS
ncbi:N-acetylmuramoyl-L-alanine amidase [Nesterenkonia haasae]|uniref:N-acetylmuramoyl-L-alanine amidase n=1 Tax=Nesterenkonia haasae TaxID=2587813 RepID=UPI001390BD4C|nr:N-acetylmuramoyl-L-alanine amidase [Nesterenkonia haasae]NDK31170.1 hypothetical protein [Nesterenkonia haasae]